MKISVWLPISSLGFTLLCSSSPVTSSPEVYGLHQHRLRFKRVGESKDDVPKKMNTTIKTNDYPRWTVLHVKSDAEKLIADVKSLLSNHICRQKEMVHEASGNTPVKSDTDVPSIMSIESLRAMPMESLLEEFRENHSFEVFAGKESKISPAPRPPLTQIN